MVEKVVGRGLLWSMLLTCSLLWSRLPFLPEFGGCPLPAVLTSPGRSPWHSHWPSHPHLRSHALGARQLGCLGTPGSPEVKGQLPWLVVGRDARGLALAGPGPRARMASFRAVGLLAQAPCSLYLPQQLFLFPCRRESNFPMG